MMAVGRIQATRDHFRTVKSKSSLHIRGMSPRKSLLKRKSHPRLGTGSRSGTTSRKLRMHPRMAKSEDQRAPPPPATAVPSAPIEVCHILPLGICIVLCFFFSKKKIEGNLAGGSADRALRSRTHSRIIKYTPPAHQAQARWKSCKLIKPCLLRYLKS